MMNLKRAKSLHQTCLKRLGIYHRLKASFVYEVYWRFANRAVVDDRLQEVAFYRTLLKGFHDGEIIYDVGANVGYKTGIFLQLGARVVAIEPDPVSTNILEQSFLRFRRAAKPVTIVRKAASDRCTKATMYVDKPGSAKNTLSQKWVNSLRNDALRFGQKLTFDNSSEIETTTLDEVIKDHGQPFFIKIDVEGHEPRVLRGLHWPVPFLSYEVNLPEFREEAMECIQILNTLDSKGRFNYAIDCRKGLELPGWADSEAFSETLWNCAAPSIEVFWKTGHELRS